MTEESGDVRQGFTRQRRSLIGTSLVLIFYETTSLVVRKIALFGNEISLDDPSLAGVVLWVAWLYFGLRYFQYYMDLAGKGVTEAYWARLNVLVLQLAKAAVVREFKADKEWAGAQNLALEREQIDVLHRLPRFWRLSVNGVIAADTHEGTHAQKVTNRQFAVGGWRLSVAKMRSAAYVAICTRSLTEYYLPFAVGLVPVILWVAKHV